MCTLAQSLLPLFANAATEEWQAMIHDPNQTERFLLQIVFSALAATQWILFHYAISTVETLV